MCQVVSIQEGLYRPHSTNNRNQFNIIVQRFQRLHLLRNVLVFTNYLFYLLFSG